MNFDENDNDMADLFKKKPKKEKKSSTTLLFEDEGLNQDDIFIKKKKESKTTTATNNNDNSIQPPDISLQPTSSIDNNLNGTIMNDDASMSMMFKKTKKTTKAKSNNMFGDDFDSSLLGDINSTTTTAAPPPPKNSIQHHMPTGAMDTNNHMVSQQQQQDDTINPRPAKKQKRTAMSMFDGSNAAASNNNHDNTDGQGQAHVTLQGQMEQTLFSNNNNNNNPNQSSLLGPRPQNPPRFNQQRDTKVQYTAYGSKNDSNGNNGNNKKQHNNNNKAFNRDYYSMDENTSSSLSGGDHDVFYTTRVKAEPGKEGQDNNNNNNNYNNPAATTQQKNAFTAQREASRQQRQHDASGWENEQLAAALGKKVQGVNTQEISMKTESTVNIYSYYEPPIFLTQYAAQQHLHDTTNTTTTTTQTNEKQQDLFLFKQDKVKVCQKEDGNMMRLAKDGGKSIQEYRLEKERLKNNDKFWESKGNDMGKITGEDQLSELGQIALQNDGNASNVAMQDHQRRKEEIKRQHQMSEIGGYAGDEELIRQQLYLDSILFKDQYDKQKEEFLKKTEASTGQNNNNNNNNTQAITTTTTTKNDLIKDENNKNNNNNNKDGIVDDEQEDDFFKPTMVSHLAATVLNTEDSAIKGKINNIHIPTTTDDNENDNNNDDDENNNDQTKKDPQELLPTFDSDDTLTPEQKHQLKRLEIDKVRRSLPAFGCRYEFLNLLQDHNVLVVVGETGSGKTTQLCQYLYESGYANIPPPPRNYKWKPRAKKFEDGDEEEEAKILNNNNNNNNKDSTDKDGQNDDDEDEGMSKEDYYDKYPWLQSCKRIAVTQPRRVAAVSVAARVAEEMGVDLGTSCGYAIRFEECMSPYTAIKFMTDGILLRETLSDHDLNKYSCIIMDEAHERSLNTDILFGLLRDVLSRRNDLKLIVTSATMNAEAFSQFFFNAPILHISGRTFPVTIEYAPSMPADYILAAAQKALYIHLQQCIDTPMRMLDVESGKYLEKIHKQPTGDILIFMTGQDDVEATCHYIRHEMEKHNIGLPLWVLPITSTLPQDVQNRIFAPSTIRKCIVATNIAETSLTIEGVRYVIDTGLYKLKTYNPSVGMDMLTVTPISQASANQRSGRAGRTSAGICYRLYRSEEFYQELLPNNIAEIHRTNLSNVILTLKAVYKTSGKILNFPFLEKPAVASILSALYQLYLLKAINTTEDITPIGKLMTLLPLDPPLSRMLIESIKLQCLSEMLTICAMLQVPNIYHRPRERQQQYEAAHGRFSTGDGDFTTLINIYTLWAYHGYREDWCVQNYLQYKSLSKVRETRAQLANMLNNTTFLDVIIETFVSQEEKEKALKQAKILFDNQNINNNNNNRQQQQQGNRKYSSFNTNNNNNNNTNKKKSLKQLQYEQYDIYHIYQALLQQTQRIVHSTIQPEQYHNIKKCVCAGYFHNAARVVNGTVYKNVRTGISCDVHHTSALGSGNDYVVYQDIVITTKNYMRMVSVVEPEWLIEYGDLLYKVRQPASAAAQQKPWLGISSFVKEGGSGGAQQGNNNNGGGSSAWF